jgi:hypothetical protein
LDGADTSTAALSIGKLVWAPLPLNADATGGANGSEEVVWWPCEAIDPFNPPRGFKLLPEHKLALPLEQRKTHLPLEGPGDSPPDAASAAGGGAGSSGSTEEQQQPPEGRRKLLLIWFHKAGFEWRPEDELLPFAANKQRIKGRWWAQRVERWWQPVSSAEVHTRACRHMLTRSCCHHCCHLLLQPSHPPTAATHALIDAGRISRPQDWKSAYTETKHCHTIITRAAKVKARQAELAGLAGPAAANMAAAEVSDGADADSSDDGGENDHRAAIAGRAAKQALAVNMKMPRWEPPAASARVSGLVVLRVLGHVPSELCQQLASRGDVLGSPPMCPQPTVRHNLPFLMQVQGVRVVHADDQLRAPLPAGARHCCRCCRPRWRAAVCAGRQGGGCRH